MGKVVISSYILKSLKNKCGNDTIMYDFIRNLLEDDNYQWKKSYNEQIEKTLKRWAK